MNKIFDVAGIGFGPANIALAALFDDEKLFDKSVFLDKSENPVWQEEMLFENALDIHSNIQNIPHRDLATLRSPRSKYTFLNYLHSTGRLLNHLNMDLMMPMRPDFAGYIKWVSDQLKDQFIGGSTVEKITMLDDVHDHVYRIDIADRDPVFSRHVVVGTGRDPYIPRAFQSLVGGDRVFHLNRYKTAHTKLIEQGARKFAVVGSSQSAVEIVLHLSKYEPRLEIHNFMRRFAFPLKDTNPFMSEIFFPSFTDMYYGADADLKKRIDRDVHRTNYGACDMDVLEELYRQLYYDRMHGTNQVNIHRLTDVLEAREDGGVVHLTVRDGQTGETRTEQFDGVILATGFRNIGTDERSIRVPGALQELQSALDLDQDGCIQVGRDYCARLKPEFSQAGCIILNGLCEASHGMGDAGSLSLLAPRARTIATAMAARDGEKTHSFAAQ